jgi:sec-independent protein translocase protein TatA
VPFIDNIVQPTHLILILAVALLVLGPKRLPEVGRSIGRGLHDFRGAIDGVKSDLTGHDDAEPATPAGAPAASARTASDRQA